MWDIEQQFPATDLPAYCRKCRASGGCGSACPRPQLLPECRDAVRAYDTCDTQWRVGMGGPTGLDYAACVATLTLYLPRWQAAAEPDAAIHHLTVADLLDDVRTIEHALLAAQSEQAQKKRDQEKPE